MGFVFPMMMTLRALFLNIKHQFLSKEKAFLLISPLHILILPTKKSRAQRPREVRATQSHTANKGPNLISVFQLLNPQSPHWLPTPQFLSEPEQV